MKRNSIVSIVKGNDPVAISKKSVTPLGGIKNFIKKSDIVLIKPNLVVPLSHETGVTTSPLVVKAIIELLKENGNEKIIVGDSPFFPFSAKDCFEKTGMREIVEDLGAEVVYFDEEKYISIENHQGTILKKVMVPESVVKCDSIISVPKMKCHSQTIVSLSLKNQIGVLSPEDKKKYHRDDLHQKVIDVHLALKSKLKLAIMDATYALEGQGPTYGNPINLNLVLASNDFVALDTVSCEIMNYKAGSITHLRLAAQQNLGESELNKMTILGEEIKKIQYPFVKASQDIIGIFPNVHVYVGGACQTGCFAWARTGIDSLVKKGELSKYGDISIIMGIDPVVPEKIQGTCFIIGDCAKDYQDKGIFIPGCPPFLTYKTIRDNLIKLGT